MRRPTVNLIIGTKGSGKSWMLRRKLIASRRVLLLDPMQEHQEVDEPPPTLSDRVAWYAQYLDPLRWQPPDRPGRQTYRTDDVDELFRMVSPAYGWTIAIDEAHNCWQTHRDKLEKNIRVHRHRKQTWWLVAHRIRFCPYAILSIVDRVYVFRTVLKPDLDTLEDWTTLDADEISTLGVGKYRLWEPWPGSRK